MQRRSAVVAMVALALVATAWVGVVIWGESEPGYIRASYDIYAAHYPSVIYALQSLRAGHGLLWNPFQNCGQPFLPSTLVGLFYPLHALFLLVDVDTGFLVIAALHLAIAGVFAFLLCREYGLGTVGALAGGLAFMLGGGAVALAVWLPTTILGPYVWIPASLLMTERILKSPSVAQGIGLGVVLTLGLLPGYPQISFFTYQLIALRVAWELATRPAARRAGVLGCIALGLALPAFLGAAYLFPSVEFARESVRGKALLAEEIEPIRVDTWGAFSSSGGLMTNSFVPVFTLLPTALTAFAFAHRDQWRVTAFYVFATALYMLLAFYHPLFAVYRALPMGSAFREPMRFTWIVSFTLAILVGIGADRVAATAPGSARRTLACSGILVLGVGIFYFFCRRPFSRAEWLLLALGLATVATAARAGGRALVVSAALPVLVGANLFLQTMHPYMLRIADAPGLFYRHADAFQELRKRISVQDRAYPVGEHQDYSLTSKVASIFGVPSIVDYEPQTSQRFAELTVKLFLNMPMKTVNAFNFRLNAVPVSWPLVDLLATRYLLIDDAGNRFKVPLKPSLAPLWRDEHVRLVENPTAFPRAYWVPRVEVGEPATMIDRLVSPEHDARRVALVEEEPPDRFVGDDAPGSGEVVTMTDDAEVVRLHVRASREGFLVLTDQYYPGWEATVNDAPARILRANYAFRAVRVPAGESDVVFRYRPRSVRWGIGASLASLVAIAAFFVIGGVRSR